MKFTKKQPVRVFNVGDGNGIQIRHCADIDLCADEQVTFVTNSGTEFDVVRKTWGYYATPSLNGRLRDFALRAVLVRSVQFGKVYLLLVEEGFEESFQQYIDLDGMHIITWLDADEEIDRVVAALTIDNI